MNQIYFFANDALTKRMQFSDAFLRNFYPFNFKYFCLNWRQICLLYKTLALNLRQIGFLPQITNYEILLLLKLILK